MSEYNIEQSFVGWCKRHGYWTVRLKLNPGRGWPDRAVLLPNNVMVWIEFKGATGDTSPIQDFIINKMRKKGHLVFVCRTLEEAVEALHETERLSARSNSVSDEEASSGRKAGGRSVA